MSSTQCIGSRVWIFRIQGPGVLDLEKLGDYWINVRDPLYFLGYGIPYIYAKRMG